MIPAPWSVDPDDRPDMEHNNHVIAANGNTVCFMAWSGDHENNEAHERAAQLIAAAPELLEALKAVVAVADRSTREFDLARAAIAKAETL